MSRNCTIYVDNSGPCSSTSSGIISTVFGELGRPLYPTDKSRIGKLISDPTGNGNGYGITRSGVNKDPISFLSQLQEQFSFKVHTSNGDMKYHAWMNKNVINEIKTILDEIYNTTNFKFTQSPSCYRSGATVSSGNYSWHAYGIAIDINQDKNPYTFSDLSSEGDSEVRIRTINHPVVQIFYKYGWYWGGIWDSKKDYMHFCKVDG